MSKEIVVLSAQNFCKVDLNDNDIIISIAHPGDENPRPTPNHKRLDLQFHDVLENYSYLNPGEWKPISPEQAEAIVDFVQENLQSADRIIVHCAAGMSRSPGVAVGIARYFDIDENGLRDKYPHFNLEVAKAIWRVCQRRDL